MDQCVTDIPPLRAVAGSSDHRSACWLPVEEVGFSDEVEARRETVAKARRTELAASRSAAVDDDDVDGSAVETPAEEVAKPTARKRTSSSPEAATTRRTGEPAPPAVRRGQAPAKRTRKATS
jgi:hypothetical protein